MKIVIADDDDAIRHLLALGIRSMGHEVLEARDGAEAVELGLSISPDAIFLDVLMPRLNGFDALAALRAGGYQGKAVIVTALTSQSTEKLDSGVAPDAMLAKPFRRRDLLRVLDELLAEPGEAASGDRPGEAPGEAR